MNNNRRVQLLSKSILFMCVMATISIVPFANAFINPNFTPVELIDQADFLIVAKMVPVDAKGVAKLKITECLKGEDVAPKGFVTIDTTQARNDSFSKAFQKKFESYKGEDVLIFVGKGEQEEDLGMLHVGGKWIALGPSDDNTVWFADELSDKMEGTWAGGTDMLLAESKLLLKYEEITTPVASGVEWADKVKIATLQGKVSSTKAVDINGDGNSVIFFGSDAGDRIFVHTDGKYIDETAKRKVSSKSVKSLWADLNNDGILDLVSFNGKEVVVYLADKKGALTAGKTIHKSGTCLGLNILDSDVAGAPAVLVSTAKGPVLLKQDAKGAFTSAPIAADVSALGGVGRCLVADFDDDGKVDIIQTGGTRSLIMLGKAPASFGKAKPCPIALNTAPSDAFIGDYDADGRLDVFCISVDGCALWHNYPGLNFKSMIHISGEVAYISKPNSIFGNTCDVNNDGMQDIYMGYSEDANTGPQIFFNRGFRSFGHAHSIDVNEQCLLDDNIETEGQQAGVVADVNNDGAQDQVVVLKNGEVYVFQNDIDAFDPIVLRVNIKRGSGVVGPVKVTGETEQRGLGAWNVVAGTTEAFFGQSEPGAEITIKWKLPNGKEQKKVISIEDEPIKVDLF